MSRSVSVGSGAVAVCYRDVSDIDGAFGWDDFVEDIRESSKSQWASFYDSDKWIGREDKAVVENRFVYIGVSEYCGLASVWIVPKEVDASEVGLQSGFVAKIKPQFEKLFGDLVKVGTFSNGESVYERKA